MKARGAQVTVRSGKSAAGPVSWLALGLGLGVASSWPTIVFVPQTEAVATTAETLQPAASRPPETTAVAAPHTKVATAERGWPVAGHMAPPEKAIPA